MRAMVLTAIGKPLELRELPDPAPAASQIRIKIGACGVCRTDLHVVDGELPDERPPIIPGHEIIGRVDALGADVKGFALGQRVGAPWLGHVCGHCFYCTHAMENLCDTPGFTGYTRPGGFASHVVVDADFAVPLPPEGDDVADAPLMCAGLIGWRSLKKAGDAKRLGLYGFGAAAHIIAQVAIYQGREVYAFTRAGDDASQKFARELGSAWAGASEEKPPVELDAAIIYAPVGALVPAALRALRKGGRAVCAGIHMSDIPSFPYDILWNEREIVSVANLTRADAHEFMPIARAAGIHTTTTPYPLEHANQALDDLRNGRLQGAAVLVP
ncbi:MAG TPA: zinc-dependent alcohol dehydrogenase family protein [Caulobacterales bacterium]|nr:zinc-dependent alcohol dehydrogenase family protein [Caulobacterales bacterium]